MKPCLILLGFLLLGSCSGYHLVPPDNPFARYGIESIALPLFFNHSALPNTGGPFTQEFFQLLASYRGLKVYSGTQRRADAVLLGIISSPERLHKTLLVEGRKRAKNLVSPGDIGSRNDFFTPARNRITLTLEVVLIKKPSLSELKLFQSKIAHVIDHHPKIVFKESIQLTTSFTRTFQSQGAGNFNFTKNLGALNRAIQTLAAEGREHFRESIVHAF